MDAQSKKIGVATATIVGMNAMIGAGIFSIPAALASYVGPAGILTYAFVIIAVGFMGLSMARLAQLFPQEGSFYAYTSAWAGHTVGMVCTAAYLFGLIIAMGLLVQMTGAYLHVWVLQLSEYSLGLVSLCVIIGLNVMGVHLSQVGQFILLGCTIFPLITTIIMCLTKANMQNLTPFMPYGFNHVLSATKAVIFGFFGFESAASLFSIVENPQKNVARALIYAIVLVGLLYLVFVGSIILAVPLHFFSNPKMAISEVLTHIFPHQEWLITIIHFSILSAIIGTVHSMLWSSSVLFMTYIKLCKNAFIKSFASTITHTQAVLIIGGAIFTMFATVKSIDLFFSLTATCVIFVFIMSMVQLLTMKSEWDSKQNIITILGLVTAGIMLFFALEGFISELGKLW